MALDVLLSFSFFLFAGFIIFIFPRYTPRSLVFLTYFMHDFEDVRMIMRTRRMRGLRVGGRPLIRSERERLCCI